jgi:hypothetical protein
MSKPVVLQPGGVGHVFLTTCSVGRVYWAEAPANGGTATLRDGSGAALIQIVYAGRGKGPEPVVQNYSPAILFTNGCFGSVNGGHLQIHIQGSSSSGA